MPPPKKPRCRDAPWFFLAREGLSARPEWARNRRWTMPCNVSVRGAFQLTPSARRATYDILMTSRRAQISIHALREESDSPLRPTSVQDRGFQSTPSARRATVMIWNEFFRDQFQSTPSARRATCLLRPCIQYHRLFQSTPSARRATMDDYCIILPDIISIHALREEGDKQLDRV